MDNYPTARFTMQIDVNHRRYRDDPDDRRTHLVQVDVDMAKLAATFGPQACRNKQGYSRQAKGGVTIKRLSSTPIRVVR